MRNPSLMLLDLGIGNPSLGRPRAFGSKVVGKLLGQDSLG